MFKAYIIKWAVWTLPYTSKDELIKDIQIFNSPVDIFYNETYLLSVD